MKTIKLTQDYCTSKTHGAQQVSGFYKRIPANDSVRLLSQVVEVIDLKSLYHTYSEMGRNPAVPPDIMLKILLYAYMENNYSSRGIEKSCRRDINYIWLLRGHAPPDHNTIARFRTMRLEDCLEDLFFQLIALLFTAGEIEFSNLFIDGTKIEGSAGWYTFVWKKTIEKLEKKLRHDAAKLVMAFNLEHGTGYESNEADITAQTLLKVHRHIAVKMEEEGIADVHGVGHRKHPLQRSKEKLMDLLDRKMRYDAYLEIFGDRNSFSKTDHDATFMHMKDDHMLNGQLKAAYNVQIGVDSEYIVGTMVSSERSDTLTLLPFLEHLATHLPKMCSSITADAGYESEENYAGLDQRNILPYIKPQPYAISRKKGYKKRIGLKENMDYIEDDDVFVCTQGRVLSRKGTGSSKTPSGYVRDLVFYECPSCAGCPVKGDCAGKRENKRFQVSWKLEGYRKESWKNIVSPVGIRLRINRSIQVEGAFGVLKEAYGFTRFLLRGKVKVGIEMLLLCFAYNVNKLHHKIQGNRTGHHLHFQNTG